MPHRMTHKKHKERREGAVAKLKTGVSAADVAAEFGFSPGYVCLLARQSGVSLAAESRICQQVKQFNAYAMIADLCNTDRTMTDIAAGRGVSVQRVSQIYARCREAGVPVRERPSGYHRPARTS